MKYCWNCGAKLPVAQASFCINCGTDLHQINPQPQTQTSETPQVEPVSKPQPEPLEVIRIKPVFSLPLMLIRYYSNPVIYAIVLWASFMSNVFGENLASRSIFSGLQQKKIA